MGLTEDDWQSLDYEQQLAALAYERLRQREESST
jgi:hypothetical protein